MREKIYCVPLSETGAMSGPNIALLMFFAF